jgi:uncharacterized protein YwgA
MNIPNSWNEISLEKYLELIEVDLNEEYSFFTKSLEKLCIITDSDEWEEEPSNVVYKVVSDNKWILTPPSINYKLKIDLWSLKPFNKFTLAEWIDLEKYIIDKKYQNIIALSYRKTKEDEWGNIIFEPYSFNCNERSNQFLNYSINDVFGVIESSIKFRDDLLNSFRELFESVEEEDFEVTDEEKQLMSNEEIKEIKEEIKKDNEKKHYSWQKLLDDISGGNWSYIESILNLPVVFVFNMMMMKKKFN